MNRIRAAKLTILCALVIFVASQAIAVSMNRVVLRTGTGFEPRRIMILPGTKVRFVNSTDAPTWPASDLHPSHSLYAEFDPGRIVDVGEEWSFSFDKDGVWTYHDHMKSGMTGTVFVLGLKSIASLMPNRLSGGESGSWSDACTQDDPDSRIQCWRKYVRDKIRSDGVAIAMSDIADHYDDSMYLEQYCHDLTHIVGQEAYLLFRGGKKVSFTKDQAICTWGFYHGFMERMLQDTDTLHEAAAMCERIEESNDVVRMELIMNCYHGLGHGAVLKHEKDPSYDFWKVLDVGVNLCEEASPVYTQRMNCVSGVIDGTLATGIAGNYPLPRSIYTDPYSICRKYHEYDKACYSALNWFLLQSHDTDFIRAAAFVETISDRAIAADTMMWLANLAVRVLTEDNTGDPGEWCLSFSDYLQKPCIGGFALGFAMNKGVPGKEYVAGLEFCETGVVSASQKEDCYTAILKDIVTDSGKDRMKAVCSEYSLEAIPVCRDEP